MDHAAPPAGGFHGYRSSSSSSSRPRPSSPTAPAPGKSPAENKAAPEECTVREQDRFMPIANVIRIMRKILPPHAKISDDAKETIQECVSEYISFITSEANERCQREQRKTITAEDVLFAMSKLGFDDYIEPLTLYLHRFRDLEGGDRAAAAGSSSTVQLPGSVKRSNVNGGLMLDFLASNSAAGFSTGSASFHHQHGGFYGGGGANVASALPRGNGGSSNGNHHPNNDHPIFGQHHQHK
ncbi:Nuclear transcription factor Y subunit B-6 [Linum grandiflorum]